MIKMIAFDLDGTVLDEDKRISAGTKAILERAAGRGIEIVPATGRPLCGIFEEVNRLQGIHYILTTNGAAIYEKATGRCVYENSMPLQQFLPLMERLETLEVMADAFVKGECYMDMDKRRLVEKMNVTEAVREYIRESRTCVEGLAGYLRERGDDVQKVTVNFVENPDGTRRDYEKVAAIVQEFPEFAVVSGGMGNVEITARSASKGEGLARLGEMLGIGSEEILAFGDSGNDVSMLRMAGVGVAMENGEPEAKEAADFVTKKNTEGGVVYAIEKFVPELAQCASEKEERA